MKHKTNDIMHMQAGEGRGAGEGRQAGHPDTLLGQDGGRVTGRQDRACNTYSQCSTFLSKGSTILSSHLQGVMPWTPTPPLTPRYHWWCSPATLPLPSIPAPPSSCILLSNVRQFMSPTYFLYISMVYPCFRFFNYAKKSVYPLISSWVLFYTLLKCTPNPMTLLMIKFILFFFDDWHVDCFLRV